MKLVTDNAFSKAWKISCPTCRIDQPNSILWFKKQCHECEIKVVTDKKYTEKQLLDAMSFAECYIIEHDKPLFLKSNGKPVPDCLEYIKSLNKQD